MSEQKYKLAMVGLGVMGRNLVLNIADHGFSVSGYDKDPSKVQELRLEAGDRLINAARSLDEFIGVLARPRVIMLLVPAGKVVDSVILELVPLLEQGDLIIDAGNSHTVYGDGGFRRRGRCPPWSQPDAGWSPGSL
jgi:6-phosphogluconate dehydrogenase